MKIYDYIYKGSKNICGKQIQAARRNLHMTQAELAAQMQIRGIVIERDSISRIEIGTRFVTDYELRHFSEILHVSFQWLVNQSSCE